MPFLKVVNSLGNGAGIREAGDTTAAQIDIGVRSRKFVLFPDTGRVHDVIAVHSGDKIPGCGGEPSIQSGDNSPRLWQFDNLKSVIMQKGGEFVRGAICGTIIDDNNFNVIEFLVDN